MAQLVKYRTVSGTAPRIPIQDVVLNMSKIVSVDTDVRTGRGVLVYQNDVELSTIYTSEVASYTKTKLTGYVTALAVKYDVFEGEKDQYFIVDEIVYAIRHQNDPNNKTDIYVTNGTDTLVNKVTIMASLETLIADANQVSFNGATWGYVGGNILDQLDLQAEFNTKVDEATTITINSVTYDLSANRSWTIGTGIAIGDTVTNGNEGSVLFLGASGALSQDNANLFWNDANNRLGIGTSSPSGKLDIVSIVEGFPGAYNDNLKLTAASYPTLWFNRSSDGEGYLYGVDNNGLNLSSVSGVSATSRMVIKYNGYVGIGLLDSSAIVHAKAKVATDVVSIFQGTDSQERNLTEWRNVSDTVVAFVQPNGLATFKEQININQLYFQQGGGAYILPHNQGLTFYNNSANGVGLLNLGGTTSAFPALKRSGALLEIRLADDSSYTQIKSSLFIGRGALDYINTENNAYSAFRFDNSGYTESWLPTYFGGYLGSMPTAFVDIAASTTARASLRLRSGSLPTVPNAGDISYDGAFKGWNGSSWLTFGGGGGGISIGDTITGATTNSAFFYNGGLAQDNTNFSYTIGTITLKATNITSSSIAAISSGNLNIKDYTGAVRLTISIDGTYFLGVGQIATNTSFGNNALRVATGGADNNTAFGYYALAATTGGTAQYNSAFGTSALSSNVGGYSNNAFGRLALGSNTSGANNTAVGHTALYSNTTGVGNIGIGLDANRKGTTANYNTAIGTAAMYGGTTPTGGNNVAIGYAALENYTSGVFNTIIGTNSGGGLTTGSYNTIIGKVTGLSGSLSNSIIIADGNGNRGFEWNTPRFKIYGDTLNINTAKTPASAAAAGTAGDIVWDTDYVYVCTATNTWKRAAIATW